MADKTFNFDDDEEEPVKKPAPPRPAARKPESDPGRPASKPAARPAPPPRRDDDEDEDEEDDRPRKSKVIRRRGTKRFQLVCELDLKALIVPTILWSLLIVFTFWLAMPFFLYYFAKKIINNVSVEEFD